MARSLILSCMAKESGGAMWASGFSFTVYPAAEVLQVSLSHLRSCLPSTVRGELGVNPDTSA